MTARAGVEPTTLRLKVVDSAKAPSRPTMMMMTLSTQRCMLSTILQQAPSQATYSPFLNVLCNNNCVIIIMPRCFCLSISLPLSRALSVCLSPLFALLLPLVLFVSKTYRQYRGLSAKSVALTLIHVRIKRQIRLPTTPTNSIKSSETISCVLPSSLLSKMSTSTLHSDIGDDDDVDNDVDYDVDGASGASGEKHEEESVD